MSLGKPQIPAILRGRGKNRLGSVDMDMDFDVTLRRECGDGAVFDYGIIHGSSEVVFIKSGRGGSHVGLDGKYVRMARRMNDSCGCTVIAASNPLEPKESYPIDRSVIENYASERGFDGFSLRLIGSSNGAYQNLLLANLMPQTRRVMCINMPLMLDFHKTKRELSRMVGIGKVFVYGSADPSYRYAPMLEIQRYPDCRFIYVEGADHQFAGRSDELVALADEVWTL